MHWNAQCLMYSKFMYAMKRIVYIYFNIVVSNFYTVYLSQQSDKF